MPFTPAVDHVGSPPSASPEITVGGPSSAAEGGMDVDAPENSHNLAPGDELGDEGEIRRREVEELTALVHSDLKADVGANTTGIYELVGESISFGRVESDVESVTPSRDGDPQGGQCRFRALYRLCSSRRGE